MKKMLCRLVLLAGLLALVGCGSGGDSSPLSGDTGGTTGGDTTGGGTTGGTTTTPPTVAGPGTLGAFVDTGDLAGTIGIGDDWLYTRVIGMNNTAAPLLVGQSNNGAPVKAAFSWDSATDVMTYLGIHFNGPYSDYYNLNVSSPALDFFIYSEAVKVNDSGAIIGNSTTGTGWPEETEKRAFYYTPGGGFVDLPPESWLNTNDPPTREFGTFSEVADINNQGQVVLTVDDFTGRHGYFWDGSSTRVVGSIVDSDGNPRPDLTVPNYVFLGRIIGSDGEAVALNEFNQAVVNSAGTAVFHDLGDDVNNPNDDFIESLNHLPEQSSTFAVDMNNAQPVGHIVGTSGNQGFFWDGGAMYPIGTLGGTSSEAVDINDQDQVAGNATTADGTTHAIIWELSANDAGQITDLGTLGGANSFATAINENGDVIGYSETGATYSEGGQTVAVTHGFLYRNGVMYDLGTHDDFYPFSIAFPYPFSEPAAINDAAQVGGSSITINAHSRGFFLDPTFP